MVEALGLAVAAEIPIVVVDVMRVGPSTGIPTKSEQGDLNIAVHGLHGDAPHLVLACQLGRRLPRHDAVGGAARRGAAVAGDRAVGPVPRPGAGGGGSTAGHRRGRRTHGRRWPRARPATALRGHRATACRRWRSRARRDSPTPRTASSTPSAAHPPRRPPTTSRSSTSAGASSRPTTTATRWADLEGDRDADRAIITFGSCTGPVREGLARAAADGVAARLVSLRLLAPLPVAIACSQRSQGVRRVLVIEQNHSAQLYKYLRGGVRPAGPRHEPAPAGRAAVLARRDPPSPGRMEPRMNELVAQTPARRRRCAGRTTTSPTSSRSGARAAATSASSTRSPRRWRRWRSSRRTWRSSRASAARRASPPTWRATASTACTAARSRPARA